MAVIECPKCGAKNRIDDARADRLQPVCGRCGTKLAATGASGGDGSAGRPVTATDDTLASLLSGAGERPVLIDCWAPWCGPCRMIAPTIDALAAEAAGRYVVAKLNVDENPTTAGQYRVDAIPALLLFRGGRLVERVVGLQPKDAIAARLAAAAES